MWTEEEENIGRAEADLEASERLQDLWPKYNEFKERMELMPIKREEAPSPECRI